MSGKNLFFLTVLMSAVVLAGCDNVNINIDNVPAEDIPEVSTVEDEPGEDVSGSEDTEGTEDVAGTEEVTGTEDDGTAADELTSNVSDEEIEEIRDDFVSRRYNGFLVAEFRNPEEIQWNEVLYLGSGIVTDEFADAEKEIAKLYGEEWDYDPYEFGGVDIIKAEDMVNYIKDTSGIEIKKGDKVDGFSYYEKWDVYASSSATDTNEVGVDIKSVNLEDDIYTVDYISFDVPMEVKMKRNGDSWQFISNEWNPEGGRDAAISAMYDEIIEKYKAALDEGWDENKIKKEKLSGMLSLWTGKGDAVDRLGYALMDIDDDGTDELLLGEVAKGDRPNLLYQIYYAKRGNRSWIYDIDAGPKTFYYLADDNTIYKDTSGGATDGRLVHIELCHMAQYLDIRPLDVMVYSEDGPAGADKPWYSSEGYGYDNTDNWKSISESEFNEKTDKAKASYVQIDFTPFSEPDKPWKNHTLDVE